MNDHNDLRQKLEQIVNNPGENADTSPSSPLHVLSKMLEGNASPIIEWNMKSDYDRGLFEHEGVLKQWGEITIQFADGETVSEQWEYRPRR